MLRNRGRRVGTIRITRSDIDPFIQALSDWCAYERLKVRKIGVEKGFLKVNIYSDTDRRYAMKRMAGKLERRGCVIRRFGDPNSIIVLIPLSTR